VNNASTEISAVEGADVDGQGDSNLTEMSDALHTRIEATEPNPL
jgi:hypothetical protein